MDTEVEIKFFVSRKAGEKLPELLKNYQICTQNEHDLQNVYFDTSERLLKKRGIGLRVRSHDGKNEQTIKLQGSVVGGLHQRPEYNEPIAGIQPELARFKGDIWPEDLSLSDIQQALIPIFSNDFTRQTWVVDINGEGLVEVAFDLGEIHSKGQTERICEIELELLKGHEGLLFQLGQDIATLPGARLVNVSKAQRGFALASGDIPPPVALSFAPIASTGTVFTGLQQVFSFALQYWQYHEHLYLQHQMPALSNMRDGVHLMHQGLLLFSPYLPKALRVTWLADLNWLSSKLKCIDRYYALSNLTADKGSYIKKLEKIKPLRQQLKAELKSLPHYKQMKRLFTSERYCKLVLNISAWLVGLSKMTPPAEHPTMAEFAKQALDNSWQELQSSPLVQASELSSSQYIALQGLLSRNLMVGLCLGGDSEPQRRDDFRFPWLDILQGMEELKSLKPIYDYLETEQDEEAQERILKWLKRKEGSLLLAMEQSRQQALIHPIYW
ncbi:CYTH domain-containing protein [Motilimonas cestriensis]|uniref:CYTH and CHAD domain-containing protein n=1 Tax=Motilimonas cestriensis TaxID=2742685 RepID=UPI003DA66418